jgi:DtxR family Mn-dependent transcriptional regulator
VARSHPARPAEEVVEAGLHPPSQTAARYLEAMYYLRQEGEEVRPGRLADWLRVSPPTVTVAVQRLIRDGLVKARVDRTLNLTAAGEKAAAAAVRRHRVVECWLTEELGLDWVTADAEAERVAYTLSDVVLERLYERLGEPTTCPHGNDIPGHGPDRRDLVSLAELPPSRPARVSRISELAEHHAPAVLGLLDREGVVPGVTVSVAGGPTQLGVVTVAVGRRIVVLSQATAASVWVERPSP